MKINGKIKMKFQILQNKNKQIRKEAHQNHLIRIIIKVVTVLQKVKIIVYNIMVLIAVDKGISNKYSIMPMTLIMKIQKVKDV
jgi:hypothetical protein